MFHLRFNSRRMAHFLRSGPVAYGATPTKRQHLAMPAEPPSGRCAVTGIVGGSTGRSSSQFKGILHIRRLWAKSGIYRFTILRHTQTQTIKVEASIAQLFLRNTMKSSAGHLPSEIRNGRTFGFMLRL